MKILIIYPTLTHPVNAGNKHWVMSQANELRQLGNDVYMLCINIPGLKDDITQNRMDLEITKNYWGKKGFIFNATKWQRIKTSIIINWRKWFYKGYFKCDDLYPTRFTSYVNKLNAIYHFDACIVNYYWLTKIFETVDIKIKVINTHDVFAYRDLVLDTPKAWMCTSPNEEARGLQRANYALALQDEEAAYFSRIAPHTKVLNVYCPYQLVDTDVVHNHNIVILSSLGKLNIDGLEWFINIVFPSIVERFNDVKLIIGGRVCQALGNYINNNIVLLGTVDSPYDLYKLGDVAINPCRSGTGLKVKTFESLSYGKVTMVHPHSMIGIYKKDQAPIFASDSAKDWVNFLETIWTSEARLIQQKAASLDYITDMNMHIEAEYKKILD